MLVYALITVYMEKNVSLKWPSCEEHGATTLLNSLGKKLVKYLGA